ncbi:sugar ABC transporter substrate-binding protein [Streptomyces sp. NP160]|uniref:ABC transporter substrate-binding protein n=1 Tax=Streptomyces sp. NP160 TaxID=2586637 RepID=UPI00111863AA|nr:sugar ABC transporter substrate-binding protein [Streptomyces sp. NP160]TNM67339.1 sugar ABC transporter substrate-binding protein [Streptomyces sp. NP160]
MEALVRRPRVPSFRLPLVAASLAAVVAASGCAISSDGGGGGGGDGDKTVLTFWSYYVGAQKTWLDGRVAAFEKANPDIDVQVVETVGDQQDQRLLASVATKTTPDLFINNIVVDFPTLVAGGVTADLTPYWEKYADAGQWPEQAAWKNDGKVYNLLPFTNLLGMYYNKDVLAESGITEPPKTLDELQEDLATVKAGGKYEGLALSGAPTVEGAWLFAPQLLGEQVDYCTWADSGPKVSAAFDRLGSWTSAGYIPQAAATWDQNDSWQQFVTGRYAFAFNGNWQLGNGGDAAFQWGTAQYPAPTGGSSVVYPGGEGFGIGETSKNKDLAWKFLQEAILSPEAGEQIFTTAGSIPVRSDAAQSSAIQDDANALPFATAAQSTGQWPNNPETATAQTALGTAVSSVISGQATPADAAASATDGIAKALAEGGGTCR